VILAGDVGGTKTAVALLAPGPAGADIVREATLPSQAFATFDAAVRAFLGGGPPVAIEVACFGVAGPVVDGRCVTTNLPWELDARALALTIPAGRVVLLNDLEAAAHGVVGLGPEAFAILQPGVPREGNMAVIAAGTGLGEAFLVRDGARYVAVASEGGHCDFAPRTDIEIDLLCALRKEHGRVSWERVVSGPGSLAIYRHLRARRGTPEPAWLAARLEAEDPAAVVSEVALAGTDPVCVDALDVFVAAYGAEAGNLALKAMAIGGVFLAGGIAPKILPRLAAGNFLAAFCDKGRLADLMATIPVRVVLEPRTALLGAARVAAGLRCRPPGG
jgi:glucokinase